MNQNNKILTSWFRQTQFYSLKLLADEKEIFSQGEKNALNLFKEAANRIPAYKDFLKVNGIDENSIKSIDDFVRVPYTTKENYIDKYSLKEKCWDGKLQNNHMISTSSGTTGLPHFWPRDLRSEIDGALQHEFLLKNVFHIDKLKTLFIDGFAMGNWIAGTFTLACINLVALKGYQLTNMTPGYSLSAILETVENLVSDFDQIIITGHTPFLKELAEALSKTKIVSEKTKIILLGTGQSITENWRNYILKLLNSDDYNHTFVNLYGSADAALMGFETPLSISLRKFLSENMNISKRIFNDERTPSLYNYDPRLIYFEDVEGELCITKYNGCPLIRYNIRDNGGVIRYSQMFDNIKNNNYRSDSSKENYKFPFVYLFGREKFMVKIFGANVYTEHVQMVLDHEKLQPVLTGRFKLEINEDDNQNSQMICRVELIEGAQSDSSLEGLIKDLFIDVISKVNSEYRDALSRMGDKVKPTIFLHAHGDEKYFPANKMKKTS